MKACSSSASATTVADVTLRERSLFVSHPIQVPAQTIAETWRQFEGSFIGHEANYIPRSMHQRGAMSALAQVFFQLRLKIGIQTAVDE